MTTDRNATDSRYVVRFVDEQSGRSNVVGCAASLDVLSDSVVRILENGRAGSRFPLLRLLGRQQPLSHPECEALVREIVRLKGVLAAHSVEALRPPPPDAASDPALSAAAPLDPLPEPFPRSNGNAAPKTLADAFDGPLSALEHIARLGAASRRGARFEVGPADAVPTPGASAAPRAAAATA